MDRALAAARLDLKLDPGGLFRIPDKPVGGFELIVSAGPVINTGRDLLQRLAETSRAPDEPQDSDRCPR